MNRTTVLLLTLFALLSLTLISCQQEETEEAITEEEALATLETEFQSVDGGMTYEALDAAEVADANSAQFTANNCGWSDDSTFTYAQSQNGRSVDFSYSYAWDITCLGQIPQTFNLATQRDGTVDGPRYDGTQTCTGDYRVDSLVLGTHYLINGAYSMTAEQTFIGRRGTRNTNVELDITLTDALVPKGSQQIMSGTGTYTLVATNNYGTRTLNGIATFLGNGTVQVDINGNTYTIQI